MVGWLVVTDEGAPERVRRAADAFAALIADVNADEWDRATPCSEWDLRQLVNHVVGGTVMFVDLLNGVPLPEGEALQSFRARDFLGADAHVAFSAAAESLVDAFAAPGALDRVVASPIGAVPGSVVAHLRVTELLVHGWDVKQTLGRGSLPEDLAEQELEFSRAAVARVMPGRMPFAPPQPVADDAPASERLAALLGRSVS